MRQKHAIGTTMKSRTFVLTAGLALTLLGTQACAPIGSEASVTPSETLAPAAPVTPTPEMPTQSAPTFCDDMQNETSGVLCAVKPSGLDARTKDIYGTTTAADENLGFGYHVVGIPKNFDPNKGLWLHFTGTYGRPYHQGNRTFDSSTWLKEIMAQGYVVIQLAYDNRFSVNSDTCQAPKPGYNRNNCAGEVREEVMTGVNLTPYRATDTYNSVDFRLKVLLTFLQAQANVRLPSNLNPNNIVWSELTLSGHSQGGNHAYYVAKNRGSRFTCMLGAPYDVPDSVNPGAAQIADWFTTGSSLTSLSKLGQLIATEDDFYQSFKGGASIIGLTIEQQAFEVSQAPYLNSEGVEMSGHAAVIGVPSLETMRARACFR